MLSGKYLNYLKVDDNLNFKVLVVCLVGFEAKMGCILKATVKSEDGALS